MKMVVSGLEKSSRGLYLGRRNSIEARRSGCSSLGSKDLRTTASEDCVVLMIFGLRCQPVELLVRQVVHISGFGLKRLDANKPVSRQVWAKRELVINTQHLPSSPSLIP